MDQGAVRRTLDMLFPREWPLRLAIPDINSPAAFDNALAIAHAAWTEGRISPAEARTCQELCEHRYRGCIKAQAGKAR
jgi:hypothetical protein